MKEQTEKILQVSELKDDKNLGVVLQEHLQMNGFEVTLKTDGVAGLVTYKENSFDLCLVDIMMPIKDGITFAKEIRQFDSEIPIIFLTAKSLKEDKIEGFKAGCDDYITKPFSIEELLYRIKAVLKRSTNISSSEQITSFKIGRYTFDCNRQILSLGKEQKKLTTKESDLLKILCMNMNKIVTREEALHQTWNDPGYFAGRSMDVYISKLRKYLSRDNSVEIIGIHCKGFRLVAEQADK